MRGNLREVCSAKVRCLGERLVRHSGFTCTLKIQLKQDMELASPFLDKPVSQIEADVPLEPISLQAETADLKLALHFFDHLLFRLLERLNMILIGMIRTL